MKIKDIGEFGLIERVAKELITCPEKVVKGIGDDTAVLNTREDRLLLFTTDMMVEGVHFSFDFASPREIGKKALAVNLSDIAAMGGTPTNGVISIGVSGDVELGVIEEIYAGIKEMAQKYTVNIVGGDTVKSRDLIINIALLGEVEKNKVIYRSGAKIGDLIYVTGQLGDSAAGLELFLAQREGLPEKLSKDIIDKLKKAHLSPEPRLKEAGIMVELGQITAMNDISDGLASELYEIGRESKVGCKIALESIPISNEAKCLAELKGVNPINWALYGGEDFELVFTVNRPAKKMFEDFLLQRKVIAYQIGEIVSCEEGFNLIDKEGSKHSFLAKGYNHFRSE